MKKKEGSIDKIAIALMTIIMGGVLVFTNISFTQAMNMKAEVNAVVRQYLLDIESNGALDGTKRADLEAEVTRLGIVDPIISINDAGNYGSVISIRVKGDIPLKLYKYGEESDPVLLEFEVFRQSISKAETP